MSMSPSALPFDDIRNLVAEMPGPDEAAVATVRARDSQLTKPAGSLGQLESIVEWLAAWSGKPVPKITRPLVAIFATNHGVADKGVSAYPQSVTRQMLENFAAGGAAINQICAAYDLGLKIFDLAIDMPTPSITDEDALDEPNCAATMAYGMEAIAGGTDLLCLGEMGIANTTVAAAVFNGLFGGTAARLGWAGHRRGRSRAGAQAHGCGNGCVAPGCRRQGSSGSPAQGWRARDCRDGRRHSGRPTAAHAGDRGRFRLHGSGCGALQDGPVDA